MLDKKILIWVDKKLSTPSQRFSFLFGTSLIMVMVFFSQYLLGGIFVVGQNDNCIVDPVAAAKFQKESLNRLDQFSSVTNIPLSFLNFNLYAFNNVSVDLPGEKNVKTYLNIDILKQYTGNIKTGEFKRIYDNINVSQISDLTIERSFKFEPKINLSESSNFTSTGINAFYFVFGLPSLKVFLIIWAAFMLFVYGITSIFFSFLKFIYLGFPIRDSIRDILKT